MVDFEEVVTDPMYIGPAGGGVGILLFFIFYVFCYVIFICICTTFYCYCLWPCYLCCMGGGFFTGLNTRVKHTIFGIYTLLICIPGPCCCPFFALCGISGIICTPPCLVFLFVLAWFLPIHCVIMAVIASWMCISCCGMMYMITCTCYLCGNSWMCINPRGDLDYRADAKSKRFSMFDYQ